jgi:hypothetical protein
MKNTKLLGAIGVFTNAVRITKKEQDDVHEIVWGFWSFI